MKNPKPIQEREKEAYQKLFLMLFEMCLFFENTYDVAFHKKAEYSRSLILSSWFLYKLLDIGKKKNDRNKLFSLEVISNELLLELKEKIENIFFENAVKKWFLQSYGKDHMQKGYKWKDSIKKIIIDTIEILEHFHKFSDVTSFLYWNQIAKKITALKQKNIQSYTNWQTIDYPWNDIIVDSFFQNFSYIITNFFNKQDMFEHSTYGSKYLFLSSTLNIAKELWEKKILELNMQKWSNTILEKFLSLPIDEQLKIKENMKKVIGSYLLS